MIWTAGRLRPGAGAVLRQPAAWWLALSFAAVGVAATGARAQLPCLDPLPLPSPPDSLALRSTQVSLEHLGDGRTGWTADRLLLDVRLPVGSRGCFLLRLPWLRSDTAQLPPSVRWPGILGPASAPGWPGEAVVTGIGQFEIGAAGPLRLPLLGPLAGALAVGLPLGHGRFYPWSSAGIPARLGLKRWFGVRPGWWVGAGVVLVAHGGQGGDDLDPTAFPDGWQTGVSLEHSGLAQGFRLDWQVDARGGRRQQTVAAELRWPWRDRNGLGLRAAREITGASDRAAAWSLGLVWRLEPRPAQSGPSRAGSAGGAKGR